MLFRSMKNFLADEKEVRSADDIIRNDEAILKDFIGVLANKVFFIEGYNEITVKMILHNLDESYLVSLLKNKAIENKNIRRSPRMKYRRRRMDISSLQRKIISAIDDFEDDTVTDVSKKIMGVLDKTLEEFEEKSFSIISKIEKLGEIFKLSYSEKVILQFLYVIQRYGFNDLELDMDDIYSSNLINTLKLLLDTDIENIIEVFAPDGNLSKFNLVEERRMVSISKSAYSYLSSKTQNSLMETMCTVETPEYNLDDFHINEVDKKLTLSLLKNNPQTKLLIVGPSGSGKTTYAKSLAYESGFKSLFIRDNSDYNFVINGSSNNEEIVIIDEADDILRDSRINYSKETNKTSFNKSIDKLHNHCIFIVNSTELVHDSVLRRFDYILEFKKLTRDKKIKQWLQNVPKLSKLFNEEEVGDLIDKYDVSIGIISKAVENAFSISNKKKERIEFFNTILDSHNKFRNNLDNDGDKNEYGVDLKNVENYNLDLVNTDIPVDEILNYMTSYIDHAEKGKGFRCSLLFQGIPGTGKTEFARYLANSVGMNSYTISASNIFGPYVGQSERNIKNIFDKAKKENLVLIFDELDSFLGSRDNAVRRFEVSQVNEFLSQLDSYKGIVIGTTNYSDKFDKAAIRRFTWKVNFKAIARVNRMKAMNEFMPEIDFSEYKNEIENMDKITPGDLFVVSEKYKYLKGIDAATIINALKLEIQYKLEKNEKASAIGF